MASLSFLSPPFLVATSPRRTSRNPKSLRTLVPSSFSVPASLSDEDVSSQTPAKLVTFLGKGGSGKTTAAVLAAQHYAVAGLSTCLVLHSQDPTAEFFLNRKIGTTPVKCSHHLSAVRLETTKMLLEPLNWLKQADARLNTMQGVLEGIVGEELGVLPGMDSAFSAYRLERFLGFLGNVVQRNHSNDKFDIIIYDGISTEEMLRIIGASSTARFNDIFLSLYASLCSVSLFLIILHMILYYRLYLKYMRSLTEKTDFGRLVGPSFMRLVGEALNLNGGRSHLNGKPSSEIWDAMEDIVERGSSAFAEPRKFGCYLAMDPNNPTSVSSALRYWGCAIQAGVQVSGAFFMATSHSVLEIAEEIKDNFSPLPTAFIPHLPIGEPMDWNSIVQHVLSADARAILLEPSSKNISFLSPIKFDRVKKSVTLFMPGFDKLEIKLYQYGGGTELLVEAGDQRRVIQLPPEVQGKVGGAKLINRNLVITMQ